MLYTRRHQYAASQKLRCAPIITVNGLSVRPSGRLKTTKMFDQRRAHSGRRQRRQRFACAVGCFGAPRLQGGWALYWLGNSGRVFRIGPVARLRPKIPTKHCSGLDPACGRHSRDIRKNDSRKFKGKSAWAWQTVFCLWFDQALCDEPAGGRKGL